jgi:phosphoenolpyruvate---glycerone phosphotransferase subunit DhaL
MPVGVDAVSRWVEEFARAVGERKQELTRLDSAIGDGDHGTNMDRGMQAVVAKLEQDGTGDDIGRLLKTVGMTLVSKVGGAGGPLYGTLFIQMGSALSGKSALQAADLVAALDAGVKGVQARGKAEPGDKTMVDALAPARDALRDAVDEGLDLGDALERAAAAAREGMTATVPMVARKGRASYLGERSAGHQDPGATSSHLLLECAARTLTDTNR